MLNPIIDEFDSSVLWGPIDYEEGMLLYSLVRCIQPEICIETGTGYSTFFIVQGLHDNKKGILHSITIDEPRSTHCGNILKEAGLWEQVELHIGNSIDVLPELLATTREVTFGFIDSDHAHKHVDKELNIIYYWLSEQGVIVCHDSAENPQVGRVCQEFAVKTGLNRIRIKTSRGMDILS